MKKIPLTQDQFAIVDDEDFEELNKYNWCVRYDKGTKSYYARRSLKRNKDGVRRSSIMHRHIIKPKKGFVVDHINHDTLDNRRCNLRSVTRSQNQMNQVLLGRNKSGVTGVRWIQSNQKWMAQITKDKKQIYLGYFEDKQDAIEARKEAVIKYFGEYAYNKQNKVSK